MSFLLVIQRRGPAGETVAGKTPRRRGLSTGAPVYWTGADGITERGIAYAPSFRAVDVDSLPVLDVRPAPSVADLLREILAAVKPIRNGERNGAVFGALSAVAEKIPFFLDDSPDAETVARARAALTEHANRPAGACARCAAARGILAAADACAVFTIPPALADAIDAAREALR